MKTRIQIAKAIGSCVCLNRYQNLIDEIIKNHLNKTNKIDNNYLN